MMRASSFAAAALVLVSANAGRRSQCVTTVCAAIKTVSVCANQIRRLETETYFAKSPLQVRVLLYFAYRCFADALVAGGRFRKPLMPASAILL